MKLYKSNSLLFLQTSIFLLNNNAHGRLVDRSIFRRETLNVDLIDEVTYDAKDGILEGKGIKIASNHEGYTGDVGFVDFGGVGTSVSWLADIPITGFYEVTIRYASTSDRGPLDFLVDDIKLGSFKIEKVADSWEEWENETIKVHVTAGDDRTLKIVASTKAGPNVDKIGIRPIVPSSSNDYDDFEQDLDYRVVLYENKSLKIGDFHQSESGEFEVGLSMVGDLVVRQKRGGSSKIVWSLGKAIGKDVVGTRIYMQNDGNLVIRAEPNNRAVWTSKTAGIHGRNSGFTFGINNLGGIAILVASNQSNLIWTGGIEDNNHEIVAVGPIIPIQMPSPIPAPIDLVRPNTKPSTIALASNHKLLGRNRFVSSPNGKYQVGLDLEGKLVMREGNSYIWALQDVNGNYISNASKVFMQSDGNLVLKTSSNKGVWNSETSNNFGSEFRIDDAGQLTVVFEGTPIWIDGLPRGRYTVASSSDLTFPVRGIFYYAVC